MCGQVARSQLALPETCYTLGRELISGLDQHPSAGYMGAGVCACPDHLDVGYRFPVCGRRPGAGNQCCHLHTLASEEDA